MINKREFKGKSLIQFPSSFTVIDIETTGLSPEYNEIIELAAIKFIDSKPISTFSSLVRPQPDSDGSYVDSFITNLTGITNDMLSTAPDINSIFTDYINYIGDDILIGHNINFDINFLYDFSEKLLSKPLCNDFIDTMRISRRLHPDVSHHRLSDLCERYTIEVENAHRSLSDCETTAKCFFSLQKDILESFDSLDLFIKSCSSTKKHKIRSTDIIASISDIDILNPLYGKIFVFTGTLEKMTRKEAMQIVANHGGINGDSVTKNTNFLVLGNNDYCSTIKGGKSNKQKKAESLKLNGQEIDIISENVFYDMLLDE